jgi:hypothetical protein
MSLNYPFLRLSVAEFESMGEGHANILRKFASNLQSMVDECNKELEAETRKHRAMGRTDAFIIVTPLMDYNELTGE